MRTRFIITGHTCGQDGRVRWVGADNAAGNKSERLTLAKWNEGVVGRSNPSSTCICVPRNGIIECSSLDTRPLRVHLSVIVRSEKLAIIYPRHLSVFRASQIFEVLFIVSPNCPICKAVAHTSFRSLFLFARSRSEMS